MGPLADRINKGPSIWQEQAAEERARKPIDVKDFLNNLAKDDKPPRELTPEETLTAMKATFLPAGSIVRGRLEAGRQSEEEVSAALAGKSPNQSATKANS